MYLFVYGTLKSDEGANWMLSNTRKVCSRAITKDKFAMYDMGFPMIFPEEGGHNVIGELYEVDEPTMIALDGYEGVPSLYYRTQKEVICGDKTYTAWIYIGRPLGAEQINMYPLVAPTTEGYVEW